MKITISNKIFINDPDIKILDYCIANLTMDNPERIKKERMGVWTGNTPREIFLYEQIGSDLVLPFGCANDIHNIVPDADYTFDLARNKPFDYQSNINLYPYQKEASNKALQTRNGVLVMPCGSGKTQTALDVIAKIGLRALWLTHTQDLLNQSMARAKNVYGCDIKSYGAITGGKIDVGKGLTFATVQTMSKIDLTELKEAWNVIVVDECHKAVGTPTKCMQFYKVLSALSARYKFGVTATPRRSDGLETTMLSLLGKIIHEVPRSAVADTTCNVEVKHINTEYVPDPAVVLAGDGTLNYSSLISDLTNNNDRFELVRKTLRSLPKGEPVMVLANRVEYLDRLTKRYIANGRLGVCLSSMGNSKKAKEARKEALYKLNNGEINAIFATYQLAKEGLDVPGLRYVVFATPEKDQATVIQAAGRVARKADGKEKGTVIDFVDNFGMLIGWSKKRQRIYKKLGYDYE